MVRKSARDGESVDPGGWRGFSQSRDIARACRGFPPMREPLAVAILKGWTRALICTGFR